MKNGVGYKQKPKKNGPLFLHLVGDSKQTYRRGGPGGAGAGAASLTTDGRYVCVRVRL